MTTVYKTTIPHTIIREDDLADLGAVKGLEFILTEYAKTYGRTPDQLMVDTMFLTKERLFEWWCLHRERVHQALTLVEALDLLEARLNSIQAELGEVECDSGFLGNDMSKDREHMNAALNSLTDLRKILFSK